MLVDLADARHTVLDREANGAAVVQRQGLEADVAADGDVTVRGS